MTVILESITNLFGDLDPWICGLLSIWSRFKNIMPRHEKCVLLQVLFSGYIAKILTQEFPISEEVDLLDMSYDEGVLLLKCYMYS